MPYQIVSEYRPRGMVAMRKHVSHHRVESLGGDYPACAGGLKLYAPLAAKNKCRGALKK